MIEEDFRKSIESIHRRCELIILARGGSIKYYYTHYWKLYRSYMYLISHLIVNLWCCNFIIKFWRVTIAIKYQVYIFLMRGCDFIIFLRVRGSPGNRISRVTMHGTVNV